MTTPSYKIEWKLVLASTCPTITLLPWKKRKMVLGQQSSPVNPFNIQISVCGLLSTSDTDPFSRWDNSRPHSSKLTSSMWCAEYPPHQAGYCILTTNNNRQILSHHMYTINKKITIKVSVWTKGRNSGGNVLQKPSILLTIGMPTVSAGVSPSDHLLCCGSSFLVHRPPWALILFFGKFIVVSCPCFPHLNCGKVCPLVGCIVCTVQFLQVCFWGLRVPFKTSHQHL